MMQSMKANLGPSLLDHIKLGAMCRQHNWRTHDIFCRTVLVVFQKLGQHTRIIRTHPARKVES
jgi:hypothetical protein